MLIFSEFLMDPVSEAVHITIEIELLCIVRSKPLPEAQLYLIIEFASGFFSAFQPCSRCQISSRSIFFSCRMFSPPFLEQNECNLYSFYKVKYLFIEIKKSFLMKMPPSPLIVISSECEKSFLFVVKRTM